MVTDDPPLMREGINAVIQGAEDIIVVADADNGQQAFEMSAYIDRMSRSWSYRCRL